MLTSSFGTGEENLPHNMKFLHFNRTSISCGIGEMMDYLVLIFRREMDVWFRAVGAGA
jgi:hypothetical protein